MHHDSHCKTVHLRYQLAAGIGNLFGKHGNDAIGEVDRSAAAPRLDVHLRTSGHKMRNIGDMHAELVSTVREDFKIDRVVEVSCGFGIDRDRVSFSKVVAPNEV